MRRSFLPSFLCVLLLFLCSGLRAAGEEKTVDPFVMPSARFSGLGGIHTTQADDFYALFVNPAAFAGVSEEFSAGEITVSTYGPLFELIDLYRKTDSSSNLDISGIIGPGGFSAGLDIGGPLSLGWMGRGLGYGIFNRTRTTASVTGTKLRPLISEEFLLSGGYAFRIVDNKNHVFDAGFLGKGFFRGILNLDVSIFDAASLLDDPFGQPFGTQLGLGLDLGVSYTFRDTLGLALVCYDVYSPVLITPYDSFDAFSDKNGPSQEGSSYATVKRRLDFGVSYKISTPFIDRYISSFVLMADYHDLLGFMSLVSRNPVLNVGLGLEVKLLNALSIRAGIADALPALGFGLDLSFMELDFAIYGRELGLEPGLQSIYALDIGLLFRY